MKREFLQNLKVGEQSLPREAVDAIMAENGRDIEAARSAAVKPYAQFDSLVEENQRLKQERQAHLVDGLDAQGWKQAHEQAQQQLRQVRFEALLESAIAAEGGRSVKAISALLDLQALQQAEEPRQAIREAVQALRREDGYLFSPSAAPYARNTGVAGHQSQPQPLTLAGALREKFERK